MMDQQEPVIMHLLDTNGNLTSSQFLEESSTDTFFCGEPDPVVATQHTPVNIVVTNDIGDDSNTGFSVQGSLPSVQCSDKEDSSDSSKEDKPKVLFRLHFLHEKLYHLTLSDPLQYNTCINYVKV